MKKLLALLMGLMLLCGIAAASAEAELPYLETVDQNMYFNKTLLTSESYPQVCISPFSAYSLFESTYEEPWYVTFPGPEGAQCCEFGVNNCVFLDVSNAYSYSYHGADSYSYETFLNKCPDENNILLDGSDKIAAYIVPDYGNAFALFGLDEIKRGAKLYVSISMDLYRKLPEDSRAQTLTDLLMAEIERIKTNMTCAVNDKFWTVDACKGAKLLSSSIPGMTIVQDLPASIDFHFDGETFTARPFISHVDCEKYNIYAAAEDRSKSVRIEAEINSFSHVFYNREASEYTMVTLDDGSEWGLYVANDTDGKPYSVYASRVLSSKDDKTLYFTYQLTVGQGGMVWADLDAFKADLNTLVKTVQFPGLPE
ncbi:hypothetical protein [Aristaeella hokkaidonensis]|uniref:Uncharacterized protein n=1 Tax=Aristaeella hokkaidonensis TaxID=3046382 RepID=A0AC61N506_9FIRM|nr:hypothetical protein [Aristaeella hokkaidonensis]QUC66304.1 hypothetical protein JYE49_10575 [Aristaeella hokkaidonensis]SNT94287.1 hypothetical protein SAMN06297421_104261 [Aristaeella hokkaidonensis]